MTLTPRQMLDLPPFWLLGMLFLTWVQARGLGIGPVIDLPGQRLVGGACILAGFVLTLLAVIAFRKHNTSIVPHQVPEQMITSGVFARTRNPIYLADVAILLGVIIWLGALPSLVLVPLFIWIIRVRFILPEETRLKQKFGRGFIDYAQITPRWL